MKTKPTPERLRELFSYDPDTGAVTRRSTGGTGTLNDRGYLCFKVDGALIRAHRIAWVLAYGAWPDLPVDHRDMNKQNNRLDNLRLATCSQNNANRPALRNNKLGIKGVDLHKGRFRAKINVNNKLIHLGCFDTPEEASAAYLAAAQKYFGEFARAA